MSDFAIRVSGVSKVYHSYSKPRHRLQEMLRPVLGAVHRRFDRQYANEFWALRDVSFDVKKGEAFGIVGRNGAGKSTLLQIIAGTLTPTTGTVEVNGRVNALLELGSGFSPEFTGRENVFMNGAILGFSKEEIQAKFQEIWDFSEIGDFIDQPVKTYSSGMFVRLAFAVQAMLDPDILIVDEALSVGDVFFQNKCITRIQELRKRGNTTFIFVTHSMADIERYCDRAVLLQNGRVNELGDVDLVIHKYFAASKGIDFVAPKSLPDSLKKRAFESIDTNQDLDFIDVAPLVRQSGLPDASSVQLMKYRIADTEGRATRQFAFNDWMTISLVFQAFRDMAELSVGISLRDKYNNVVFGKTTIQNQKPFVLQNIKKGEEFRIAFKVQLSIQADEYLLSCNISEGHHAPGDSGFLQFERERKFLYGLAVCSIALTFPDGGVASFAGIANLSCEIEH